MFMWDIMLSLKVKITMSSGWASDSLHLLSPAHLESTYPNKLDNYTFLAYTILIT